MAYVYILKSKIFSKTYVGSTEDLEKRIAEHNSGKSKFSSRFSPWIIIYSEECVNIQEARKRELYFKSGAGRRHIKRNNIIPRLARSGEVWRE